MRLIDADVLWEELGILYHQNNGKVTWNDALMEIKTAPTIEQQRKKGKWLLVDGYRCSCCNYKLQTTGIPQSCPNCDAEMQQWG